MELPPWQGEESVANGSVAHNQFCGKQIAHESRSSQLKSQGHSQRHERWELQSIMNVEGGKSELIGEWC